MSRLSCHLPGWNPYSLQPVTCTLEANRSSVKCSVTGESDLFSRAKTRSDTRDMFVETRSLFGDIGIAWLACQPREVSEVKAGIALMGRGTRPLFTMFVSELISEKTTLTVAYRWLWGALSGIYKLHRVLIQLRTWHNLREKDEMAAS